jgi:hypothetical protein
LKMGPIRCPETSVQDYHSTLRNIPEERRSRFSSYFTWHGRGKERICSPLPLPPSPLVGVKYTDKY